MSAPLFEVGRIYRTRGGGGCRVLCIDRPTSDYPVVSMATDGAIRCHDEDGRSDCGSRYDLMLPPRVRYLNVDDRSGWPSLLDAQRADPSARAVVMLTLHPDGATDAEVVGRHPPPREEL